MRAEDIKVREIPIVMAAPRIPNFSDPVVLAALDALGEKAKWLTELAASGEILDLASVIDLAAFLTTAAGFIHEDRLPGRKTVDEDFLGRLLGEAHGSGREGSKRPDLRLISSQDLPA